MKKQLSLLTIILALLFFSFPAHAVNTSGWYLYQGSSSKHNFTLLHPSTWKSVTSGNTLQTFQPQSAENPKIEVEEFENQTYQQVIEYYRPEGATYTTTDDFLNATDEIVTKKVSYQSEDETSNKILIKRGSLILAITEPSSTDINAQGILESLTFTDNWHQYINYQEGYTFIFPQKFNISNSASGVQITDSLIANQIFAVNSFPGTSLENAPAQAVTSNETLQSVKEISFHGIPNTISALYKTSAGNQFSKIFVEKNGTSFAISNSSSSYYEHDVKEMLESFELIETNSQKSSYLHFKDIRDNHPNSQAINQLTVQKIINGYSDDTFRPNNNINRAELTKLIVASKTNPSTQAYKDCFTDVTNEWYAPYICYAKDQGWVNGYDDGTFRPEQEINRVEAIKIALEALASSQLDSQDLTNNSEAIDLQSDAWYMPYFNYAESKNLLDKQHIQLNDDGSYYYYPGENITRKEVAELIYRKQI